MTKAEIVNAVSDKTGIDRTTVLTSIQAFINTVMDNMSEGECIYLRGFGSFVLKKRATKTGRNITKNTTVIIPEHTIPMFRPAKDFLNIVKDTPVKSHKEA